MLTGKNASAREMMSLRCAKKTMTQKGSNKSVKELKAMLAEDEDILRLIVQIAVQEFFEAEPSGAR